MSASQERSEDAARQCMSDLMDGRVDPAHVEEACTTWSSESRARESWHAYHLIGDVLRSEELAAPVAADAAFVLALRQRLATEPVHLVPRAPTHRTPTRWRSVSVAAVAGVVVVLGVVTVLKSGGPGLGAGPAVDLASAGPPAEVVMTGKLIRDAQLDRYLAAHRRLGGGSAVGVPGAVVRSVDTIAIDEK